MNEEQTTGRYLKTTQDFLTSKEIQIGKFDDSIQIIELECQGYSLFKPGEILQKFLAFFDNLCNRAIKLRIYAKYLKITINGFEIQKDQIAKLVESIKKIGKCIKLLWVHTSDLSNVTIKDFNCLFQLIGGFCEDSNVHFQEFSLQCANWNFKDRQPNFFQFKRALEEIKKQSSSSQIQFQDKFKQKRVRIECSGWWSTAADAKIFLGFIPFKEDIKKIEQNRHKFYQKGEPFSKQSFGQQVGKFIDKMFGIIQTMIRMMSQLEHIEIDMRNNHELLELGKLRQKIASSAMKGIKQKFQKSLISMQRFTMMQEQKHLRVYIAI